MSRLFGRRAEDAPALPDLAEIAARDLGTDDSQVLGAQVITFPGQLTPEPQTTPVEEPATAPQKQDERESALEGVVLPRDPQPVDQPSGRKVATFIEERRTYLDEAPDIIPSYLRRRDEFAENARLIALYYAHLGAFHTTRSPIYLLRLMGRGPRGAARLVSTWGRWVTDAESRPVHTKAAAAGDPQAWLLLSREHSRRVRPRRIQSALVAVPATVAVLVATLVFPAHVIAVGGAALLALLGLAGKQEDRPIISQFVSVHIQRRVDADEITAAIEAIGIKGRVRFTAPIQTDGPGWRAEFDLPGAALAETVIEKRAALSAAMRRPLSTVWPETAPDVHEGHVVLWVAKQDPNKAKRRLWPLMNDGQVDLFKAFPFGFDPRGRVVPLDMMGTNMLIGGVMGSGKTSAVLTIALAAALDPTCELWIHELKGSGDLDTVRPCCHRYVSGDDDEECLASLNALKALERDLKRRKAIIKDLPLSEVPEGRKVYPHLAKRRELGLHPLVAIFDEVHTLFEHAKYGKQAAEVAGRLIKKARAYGIILILTTQRPDAASIPKAVSDNAIVRMCLAVTGHVANDLVLGTSMYKRGIRATMFDPQHDAGTGWLVRGIKGKIVRSAYIKQDEAESIGQRALALRTAAGTLTGQAAGESIQDEDDSNLIDHLHTVWPAGEDTMHSHRLVEALAAFRPDLYAGWVTTDKPVDQMSDEELREVRAARSTMLTNALKPHGVRTRQINKRGDGGGGKGLRFEDLPTPEDDTDSDDEKE